MKRSIVVIALLSLSVAGSPTPSRAQTNVVVAIGRLAENSYGPVPAAVVRSAPVMFQNLDPTLVGHDVVAVDKVACPGRPSGCPVLIASIANGPVPIEFRAELPPGMYEFFCQPHGAASMSGTLQIVA